MFFIAYSLYTVNFICIIYIFNDESFLIRYDKCLCWRTTTFPKNFITIQYNSQKIVCHGKENVYLKLNRILNYYLKFFIHLQVFHINQT